jgi:Adenylosuccinate synthetase
MSALTETVPPLLPMVSVTGTGFTVPIKLGCRASAFKLYRLVPVGSIRTCKFTPSTTPPNVNGPNPVPANEPAGMVVANVPIWKVTGSATGLIPLLLCPSVYTDRSSKAPGFGDLPTSIASLTPKALKGTPGGGGTKYTHAAIGSTGSGSGAALVRRLQRPNDLTILAKHHPDLVDFIKDTDTILRDALSKRARVVIEGSQGFGLSVLHGAHYPKATSRDTTAGTFVGEAGLSPRDVDDVTLVLRAFPIRVPGDSGPLYGEMSWAEIAEQAGLPHDYQELTTATGKVRRVGKFEPNLVRRAIQINAPTRIVLNHFDYVASGVREGRYTVDAWDFLDTIVEGPIGRKVDWIGTGPDAIGEAQEIRSSRSSTRVDASV